MNPGDIIFLSGSVPWREGWKEDARPAEIEEAIVSLSRAVFARKGRLLFGGHPSVSPLISAIAGEYYPENPGQAIRPVVTFQSEYFRPKLPDETWMMYRMGWSAIEWTPLVSAQGRKSEQEESLALMRRWMLMAEDAPKEIIQKNELHPPKAMIAVGGMEGVRDEAALFLRARDKWNGKSAGAKVYVLTSGGGAAERLMEAPELWERRLWLGKAPDPEDYAVLEKARISGDLIPIEETWWAEHKGRVPRDPAFQPYSAMIQWLLDEKI